MLLAAGQNVAGYRRHWLNGDLELPEALRATVRPRFIGRISSALAGGQRIRGYYVYLVDFPFDGRTVHAETTLYQATGSSSGRSCALIA